MVDLKLFAESDTTRQRILEAAEEVFADKGFEGSTVRDILRCAGVPNIAAVNYYFGDKERLYLEAVKAAHLHCCVQDFPDWPPGTPAETRLRDFVRTMLTRIFAPHRPSAMQLMMREMAQPSHACAEIVREYISPIAERLFGIINDLVPEAALGRKYMIGFSIVGQCLHYRQNRPYIQLLVGEEAFARFDVETVTSHIVDLTLNGIGVKT